MVNSADIENKIADTFQPMAPEFSRNPYPAYALLRSLDAPYYFEPADAWLISRYKVVDQVARNHAMVRTLDAFLGPADVAKARREMNWHDMPNHAKYVQFSLLDSDGEVHRRLRLLLLGEFTKTFVQRYRQRIESYVQPLLDDVLQAKTFDFIEDVAAHIPGHIIGNILGVPDEDCAQLRCWSEDVVQFFDVDRTDEHKSLAEQATTEFAEYLEQMIAARRENPRDDLVSTLVQAERAGRLSHTELISTCMLILMAGHGSTIDVLGTGLLNLLNHPTELDRLRQSPALAPLAVQEMIRFDCPLPFFHRYNTQPVEVDGRSFPIGTKFGLLYGSANRDEGAFPNADQFDIARQPNRHLAFGRGAHLCLGNHLSRLDMEIVFNMLLQRARKIELVGSEPGFKPGLSIRGLQRLPITVSLN